MVDPMLRDNELGRRSEDWRPPLFKPVKTRTGRLAAAARRLIYLQAESPWSDVARLLPQARGTILDVGCGAQPYRLLIHPKATYRGIDYADTRRHFGYSMPDTTYSRWSPTRRRRSAKEPTAWATPRWQPARGVRTTSRKSIYLFIN